MLKKLFGKKPIELHCYTYQSYVYKNAPIQKSKNFIPQWFKDIPPVESMILGDEIIAPRNMRTCAGFNGLFKHGFIMPLWSDLFVQIEKKGGLDYRWKFADGVTGAEIHSERQRGKYMPEAEYCHIKIASPWLFKCTEDIEFVYLQNDWCFDKPDSVVIPPASINYYHQHTSNVNLMIPRRDNDHTIEIPFGTAMAQVIPITDRPVKLVNHLVSKEDFAQMESTDNQITFKGSYYKKVAQSKKCPFH